MIWTPRLARSYSPWSEVKSSSPSNLTAEMPVADVLAFAKFSWLPDALSDFHVLPSNTSAEYVLFR